MGMIRKTLSIGTLGLVSFRSKGEKLEQAEYALAAAEASREVETAAKIEAQQMAALIAHELKATKRRRRVDAKKNVLAEEAAVAGRRLRRKARRKAKRLEKSAKESTTAAAKTVRETAEGAAKSAKETIAAATTVASDEMHHLTNVAKDRLAEVKESVTA